MIRSLFQLGLVIFVGIAVNNLFAQTDHTARRAADRAVKKLADKEKFELKYKFDVGEEVRWDVEHKATTKTQIAGTLEKSSSRTKSVKLWKIKSIDKLGNISFVHSVESTELWQQVGDAEPISFDSKSKDKAPEEFAPAMETIGKPLGVITISPNGKVVDRKVDPSRASFGIGDICTPFPNKPIEVGHRWFVPTEFAVTDEDGRNLKLKARLNYELSKVVNGVAIISFRTEVLTPIESDQIRAQLLQKMNDGYVAFDIQMGRLTTREIEWNEKVQEYAGADSFLRYTGKMTEKIVVASPNQITGARVSKAKPRQKVKRPGDAPIIRK